MGNVAFNVADWQTDGAGELDADRSIPGFRVIVICPGSGRGNPLGAGDRLMPRSRPGATASLDEI